MKRSSSVGAAAGLLAAAFLCSQAPAQTIKYSITILPGNSSNDYAWAINNNGDVAGDLHPLYNDIAFWPETGNRLLMPTPTQYTLGQAHGVNDDKAVVGGVWFPDSAATSFLWLTADIPQCDLSAGVYYPSFTVDAFDNSAADVNSPDDGCLEVVGWYYIEAENCSPGWIPKAYRWIPSSSSIVEPLQVGGTCSAVMATGVNAQGDIVGCYDIYIGGEVFLWLPEARYNLANGANDLGFGAGIGQDNLVLMVAPRISDAVDGLPVVLYTGAIDSSQTPGSYLWKPGMSTGTWLNPGPAQGYNLNNPASLEELTVVGTASGQAIMWKDCAIFDLNQLIDPNAGSGWLTVATDVNNDGQISGYATPSYGVGTPFRLTPLEGADLTPPKLVSAVSRKTHGAAGDFDIEMPLGAYGGYLVPENRGIEPRHVWWDYNQNVGNALTIVATFSEPIGNPEQDLVGCVQAMANGNPAGFRSVVYANPQHTQIAATVEPDYIPSDTLVDVAFLSDYNGLKDLSGNMLGGCDCEFRLKNTVRVHVLLGDVDGDADVDQDDVDAVQSNIDPNNLVTVSNFIYDLDLSGYVACADLAIFNTHYQMELDAPECTPIIVSAKSVKDHGDAGVLGIPLALTGAASIETRADGPTQIIVTYDMTIGGTPAITLSEGYLGNVTENGSDLIINTYSVPDISCLTITIDGVASADGVFVAPTATLKVAVREGDVNGDGYTNGGDMAAIRVRCSSNPVTEANCKYDVNLDGYVDSTDMAVVRGLSSAIETPACSN